MKININYIKTPINKIKAKIKRPKNGKKTKR